MSARQQCLALIAEHNADLIEQESWVGHTLDVWLPAGLAWRTTGCHSLVVREETRPAVWRELLAELREGVEPCDNTECDTCHPERVDTSD